MGEEAYADLVALCQFLPGPASSQVGMGIGLQQAGLRGALAAWAGFTLPSALVLVLAALGLAQLGESVPAGLIQGLKLVAVAVVAQAVWGMARTLCPDAPRLSVMVGAACLSLMVPSVWGQVGVILLAAVVGLVLQRPVGQAVAASNPSAHRRAGLVWLMAFVILLVGLPLAASLIPGQGLQIVDAFYRAGALVFGGGHVVLPLLEAEVVPTGWVGEQAFLAGYGLTQAVPGPLFTFAAFLGASMSGEWGGWSGGLLALLAVFLPSFLLVAGVLPFWEQLRVRPRIRAALGGVNAAVVGLLLAALYDPVWTSAVRDASDFGVVAVAMLALMAWKFPPWVVVAGMALFGFLRG